MLGQGSTGAANDLLGATQLATRMVVEFGHSTQLGPVSYSDASGSSGSGQEILGHPYSEGTQRVIDQEVARLVREAEQSALALLQTHRPALDRLAERLLAEETVDGTVVLAILRDADTTASAGGPTDGRAAAERLA